MSRGARARDGAAASAEAWRRSVTETFNFLKRCTRLDQLYARALEVGSSGWLVPVGDLHAGDDELVASLARWREESMSASPTRFPVTIGGTRKWLTEQVIGRADRLLFLAADSRGRHVGHLGVTIGQLDRRQLEYGYLLRGEPAPRGLMRRAQNAMFRWCFQELGAEEVFCLTLSDNARALDFLLGSAGARKTRQIPLRRRIAEDRSELVAVGPEDTDPPDAHYTVIEFSSPRTEAEPAEIDIAGPSISARESAYALDAARHGWGPDRSGYLDRLTEAFAAYVGVPYALPTSSCTGAMHLALLAAGVGSGDQVIVPDLTWVATAAAVVLCGADPVFVDVLNGSWCMDPSAFGAAITPRTKAVIPVHLYGHPAPMAEIVEIAREHGLFVLEDAAAAVGAESASSRAGGIGDAGAFSFQGAKLLVAGEGGMLVTGDHQLFERARHLWDQGRAGEHPFWVTAIAPKYRMANVQAAIALAQLERVEEMLDAKRRVHGLYREQLDTVDGLQLSTELPGARATHWMTTVLVGEDLAVSRDDLARELAERNIDTRPTFLPVSTYPMFAGRHPPGEVSARVAATGLNLPSGVGLSEAQVRRVADSIREVTNPRSTSRTQSTASSSRPG